MDEEFKKPNKLEKFKTFLQISIAVNILLVAGAISYSLFTQQKLDDSLLIADISASYKKELESQFGLTQPESQTVAYYANSPKLQFTYIESQLEVFQDGDRLWFIYELDGQRYYTEVTETMPMTSGDLEEVYKEGTVEYRYDSLEETEEYLLITKKLGGEKVYLSTISTKIPAKLLFEFLSETIDSLKYYDEESVADIPLTFSKHGTSLTYNPLKWVRRENTANRLYLSSYSSSPSLFRLSFTPYEKEGISKEELNEMLTALVSEYAEANEAYQWDTDSIKDVPIGGVDFVSKTATMQYLQQNWVRTFYVGTTPNVNTVITIVTTATADIPSLFTELMGTIQIAESDKVTVVEPEMAGEESLKISMAQYIAAHSIANSLTRRCDTVTIVDDTQVVPETSYVSCSEKSWLATSQTVDTNFPVEPTIYNHPVLYSDVKETSGVEVTPQNVDAVLIDLIKDGYGQTSDKSETTIIGSEVKIDELTRESLSSPLEKQISEVTTVSRTSIGAQILDFKPLSTSSLSLLPWAYHTETIASALTDNYNSIQFSELGELLEDESVSSAEYDSLAKTFKSMQRREYTLVQKDTTSLLAEYMNTKDGQIDFWNNLDLRNFESVFESFGLQFNNQKLVLIAASLALLSLNILLIIIVVILSFILRRSESKPVVGDPFAAENLLKKPQV